MEGAHFAGAGEKFDHSDAMMKGGQADSCLVPFRKSQGEREG